MRTIIFLLFIMIHFLGSIEASERTKNTFWTKRSTFWTKRFDAYAKNLLEEPSKLANLGGQLQNFLIKMHRKNAQEIMHCIIWK